MPHDRTPLLTSEGHLIDFNVENDAVYERFSARTKLGILLIVSWSGMMPFFISGSFVPLISQIAKELGTTDETVSLSVSVAVFATGLGGLFGGSYSTYYGRRPVYLCVLSLVCIGSIGVAVSRSTRELMFWRFVQSFGAYPSMPVGSGVLGDIYKLEQRGTATGLFFGATLLGPLLAPLTGGLMAQYASWRAMQWSIFLAAFAGLLCALVYLPETSHPGHRGVDKIKPEMDGSIRRWKIVNPLSSLWLLRQPILLSISVSALLAALTDFMILTPLAHTLGVNYDIRSSAMLGACFVPDGLGQILAAPLAGRLSDKIIIRMRARRNGVWYPEDRLRVSLVAAATLVPLSTLFFGLLNQFVRGRTGLILNLICLFMNGLGMEMVLGPSSAYVIDITRSRSAECIAVMKALRFATVSLALTGVLPLIDRLGVALAYAVVALLAWSGFGLMWYIVHHGDYLRSLSAIGSNASLSNNDED